MPKQTDNPAQATGQADPKAWRWLQPALRRLAELGLSGRVYDAAGRQVVDGVADGSLGWFLGHRCGEFHKVDEQVRRVLAGQGDGRLPCCLPGGHCLIVPIRHRRRAVGAVAVCFVCRDQVRDGEELARFCQLRRLDRELMLRMVRQWARFDSDQLEQVGQVVRMLIEQAAEHHTIADELTGLSENLTNTYEELSLLYKISAGMKVTEKPSDYLRHVGGELMEVLAVESLAMRYFRPSEPLISEHISVGAELMAPEVEQTVWDELLARLEGGDEQVLDNQVGGDGAAELRSLARSKRVRQLAAVPMVRNGQLFGALLALNKGAGDFDSIDTKLMKSIADEMSVFLENAFLYEDLEQLLIGMLRALVSSIDAKDPYTCGHSERVGIIARQIARSASLGEEAAGRVYLSGLLHDIGKIGVPEAVLTKPGRLTKAEFTVMRRHPQIGAKILAGIKQVQDLIPGVLHHHERVDGKGYPEGLAGSDIPLFGRIIGLADCFDAMTSDRTYRRALPLEVTLAEIRRCAGTQFDPALVEAFFRADPGGLIARARQEGAADPLRGVVRRAGPLLGFEPAASERDG